MLSYRHTEHCYHIFGPWARQQIDRLGWHSSSSRDPGQGQAKWNYSLQVTESNGRRVQVKLLENLVGGYALMPDSPSAKRKRTKDPTVDDNLHLVRSAIWYDDGSIVIQAGSTQFRVHRSILCANSPVLKDMLPMEGELVEGCPILRLSDSAEDVAHLLKVLYDRRWAHNSFASFQ